MTRSTEDLGDLDPVEMNGGRQDVAGCLAGELDDPLTKVGLRHVVAGLLEVGVEVDLLGEHRLRLHDPCGVVALQHALDVVDGRVSGVGPMYVAAGGEDVVGHRAEQLGKLAQRVEPDVLRRGTGLIGVDQLGVRLRLARLELSHGTAQVGSQPAVGRSGSSASPQRRARRSWRLPLGCVASGDELGDVDESEVEVTELGAR